MPYNVSTQKKYGENPLKKKSPYKKKGPFKMKSAFKQGMWDDTATNVMNDQTLVRRGTGIG